MPFVPDNLKGLYCRQSIKECMDGKDKNSYLSHKTHKVRGSTGRLYILLREMDENSLIPWLYTGDSWVLYNIKMIIKAMGSYFFGQFNKYFTSVSCSVILSKLFYSKEYLKLCTFKSETIYKVIHFHLSYSFMVIRGSPAG